MSHQPPAISRQQLASGTLVRGGAPASCSPRALRGVRAPARGANSLSGGRASSRPIEQWTHAELLALAGKHARLFTLQAES
jgi:hypothetical protein